jgi:hypothetical protein
MSATMTRPPGPTMETPAAVDSGVRVTGIQPNEFLFESSAVTVETSTAMNAELARRSIGVEKANNAVRIEAKGRRAVWSPPSELRPGRYFFQVAGLVSRSGKQIEPELRIPFFLVESAARIPRNVVIESLVRLRISRGGPTPLPLYERPGGKYIELMKGTDRKSGAPVALAFDQAGRRVNEQQIFRELERVRASRLGKFHEDLHGRLKAGSESERLPVAIWARHEDEIRPDDKGELEGVSGEPKMPPVAAKRAEAMASRLRRVADLAEQLGAREMRVDDAAPVVFAEMRRGDIRKLAERDEIAAVFLYDPKGVDDLKDSIAVANSDDVHTAGVKGAGTKVAVWEDGPTSTTNLVIEARYTSSPATSDHSQHVHGIIKNKESGKPHGHAPECKLHSANSKDLDALRWAVKDKGCTVINQSFHRSSEPGSGTLSFDDIYKDWLILHWPYPTICQAAGNFWSGDPDGISPPSSEFVNHKGYNSLTVGNHDDTAAAMSSSSVFRNPTTSHGDRELPEVAANGTGVTTVGLTMSGTSMASPAAAGVAALLQSEDATLKSWPEGCRAILLAGATRNVVGDTWWKDVVDDDDASDGTGAVNAHEGHQIVKNRRSRNAAPTRRGWDIGTLQSSDFGTNGLSKFAYRIQVPRFWFGPRHVKVALAWDSKITTLSIFGIELPLSSQLTVDLDLKIFDKNGNVVGYSGSWDNSFEIAEFDAVPGETYDIKIRRWSGSDWTWYGIAWTVTGSLLDLSEILGAGPGRLARYAEALPHLGD